MTMGDLTLPSVYFMASRDIRMSIGPSEDLHLADFHPISLVCGVPASGHLAAGVWNSLEHHPSCSAHCVLASAWEWSGCHWRGPALACVAGRMLGVEGLEWGSTMQETGHLNCCTPEIGQICELGGIFQNIWHHQKLSRTYRSIRIPCAIACAHGFSEATRLTATLAGAVRSGNTGGHWEKLLGEESVAKT